MLPIFLKEFTKRQEDFIKGVSEGNVSKYDYYSIAIQQLEILKRNHPDNVEYLSKQAEMFHLDGNLRLADALYRQVVEKEPPKKLNDKEITLIKRFCPILLLQSSEPFPLKDFVAIHHPKKCLIGYHLFWEDDYDFPDDNEPSDHEEVWVEYEPLTEQVKNVYTWFHSRIIKTPEAVNEAIENNQRPIIRIEWGKHGSLLKGWETLKDPYTGIDLKKWMKDTYESMKQGGRMKKHPLKAHWPKGFKGNFEDYLNFEKKVDPLEWILQKPLMFKTQWVNAVLFTHCILYNFHPKMEWPDRYYSL